MHPTIPATEPTPQPPTSTSVSAPQASPVVIEPHAARPAYHRSLAPDLARGFMLLFIALANVSWYIWAAPDAPARPNGIADHITKFIAMVAIEGRSYPMFAFLFGYGMVQFYNSRRARGIEDKPVRHMLWRRHWGMVLIGFVHFMLLFEGDIIAAYGLCGLLAMVLWFRRRDKTIFVWVCIWLGLFLLGTVGMAFVEITGTESAEMVKQGSGLSLVSNPDYWANMIDKLPYLIAIPAQVVFAPLIPALMLGWLAARRQILENPGQHRTLLRWVAGVGIGLAWLSAIPGAIANVTGTEMGTLTEVSVALSMMLGVAGGIGYIALFALLADRWQAAPPTGARVIASVGQRSMSNYLLQSVLFAPLLTAWGLGLGQYLTDATAYLVALGVWGVSVGFSWWLQRRGARGPAEVVLRKMTYGKLA